MPELCTIVCNSVFVHYTFNVRVLAFQQKSLKTNISVYNKGVSLERAAAFLLEEKVYSRNLRATPPDPAPVPDPWTTLERMMETCSPGHPIGRLGKLQAPRGSPHLPPAPL